MELEVKRGCEATRGVWCASCTGTQGDLLQQLSKLSKLLLFSCRQDDGGTPFSGALVYARFPQVQPANLPLQALASEGPAAGDHHNGVLDAVGG
jgi:hypothetical protein